MVGCGPRLTQVSGTILYEDAPAKDITILLQPDSTQLGKSIPTPGLGKTDTHGGYVITSLNEKKRGVEPGPYLLSIQWIDPDPPKFRSEAEAENSEALHMKRNPYRAKGLVYFENAFSITIPSEKSFELNLDLSQAPEMPFAQ